MAGYIHLYFTDYAGTNPYLLVNSTKHKIIGNYQLKEEESSNIEKQFEELLDISVGEIVSSNDEVEQFMEYIPTLENVLQLLKDSKDKMNRSSQYIGFINKNVIPLFDKIIKDAGVYGGYTGNAVSSLKTARGNLTELKTRISTEWTSKGKIKNKKKSYESVNGREGKVIESDIVECLSGIFNIVKGAVGEIAHTMAFASANYAGLNHITAANIGGGKGLKNITAMKREDPAMKKDMQKMHESLKNASVQPKEDIHLFVDVGENGNGFVGATLLNAGISSKITKRNSVHVHSTNLRKMLEDAYPGWETFYSNLAAGLATNSSTARKLGIRPAKYRAKMTNDILQKAWQDTVTNAYKIKLADYIAGNGENSGNNVNYLIINKNVYSISSIMRQLQIDDSLAKFNIDGFNGWIGSRGAFVRFQEEYFQEDKEDRGVRSENVYEAVSKQLTSTKVNIALNYKHLTSL